MPKDIIQNLKNIQLIGKWFVIEFVHLFSHHRCNSLDQNHDLFKINVDYLIASIGEAFVCNDNDLD